MWTGEGVGVLDGRRAVQTGEEHVGLGDIMYRGISVFQSACGKGNIYF